MQNIIKEILVSQLSFPLKYKNEKEIWWEDEGGVPITIEIIDIKNEQYARREYYKDGQLCYKEDYCQGQLHGEHLVWYDNGQLYRKENYYQGRQHGEYLGWYSNGQSWYKENYYQGQRHGERLVWYRNGKLQYKAKYNHGELINAEYY